ncbi:MAG TPA: diguanylate cyclase [Longimicrobiales bacterium]|nr:diguanylate cyclase [Longimicrobiales bacterium]
MIEGEFLGRMPDEASRVETEDLRRILAVTSDEDLAALIAARLQGSARQVDVVSSLGVAREVIVSQPVTLAIIDVELSDGDGRELLAELRSESANVTTPVIMVARVATRELQAECFSLGADHIIDKPVDMEILEASVSSKLRRADEIRRESRHDALTGLPNRAAFAEAFERAVALARRNEERLTVAILDLDHFKSINDRFGHGQGDDVLRRVAHMAGDTLRRSDMLARWGGEEFVVLLPETDVAGAERALANIQRKLKETPWKAPRGDEFEVAFSAGIASVGSGAPLQEVIARADYYLYLAKANGRDRIVSEKMEVQPPNIRILLAEGDDITASLIRHRLAREGFEVIHHTRAQDASRISGAAGVSLAIVNVEGPDQEGFMLVTDLRGRSEFGDIPIILLTSMGSEAEIVRGMSLGATDYVVKPFSPVELVARVHRHLRASASAQPTTGSQA